MLNGRIKASCIRRKLRKPAFPRSVAIPMATRKNRPHRSEDTTEARQNLDHSPVYKTWGESRSLRLADFDYASPGVAYHITIGAYEKQDIFTGSSINQVIINSLKVSAKLYGYELIAYCLMPNHLHVLVQADKRPKHLSKFIRAFKSYCTNANLTETSRKLWQRSFYDHILRKDEDLAAVADYILNNPMRKGLVVEREQYEWCELQIEFLSKRGGLQCRKQN